MNIMKQYFTFKKITIFLAILFPIFFILFLAGGCSFKLIDPQYYEFKRLCGNAGKVIFGKPTKDYNNVKYIVHKEIQSRIKEISFQKAINNQVEFYINNTYFYYNYGIFLRGDEGRGWYTKFGYEILDCEDIDKN